MPTSRLVRVGGLLLAVAVGGLLAVRAAPDQGRVFGIWPVGLASAALVLWGGRRAVWLVPVVSLLAFASIATARPADVAAGYAASIGVETWLVWRLVTRGGVTPATMRDDRQLAGVLGAATAGAGVGALGCATTSIVTGFGDPALVALAIFTAHLAAQLVLLPLVGLLPEHHGVAGPTERSLQWLAVVTLTPAVFLPSDFPSLLFLVIPLLAWAGMRDAPREAMWQTVTMILIGVVATSNGVGPIAAAPDTYDLPVDARGVLLATFAVSCALVVFPIIVTAGLQLSAAREAAAERDKVRRILDGATGIAIIVTDQNGLVTTFNPGAQRLLGYRPEEVVGRSARLFHSDAQMAAKARELGMTWDHDTGYGRVALRLTEPDVAGTHLDFLHKDGTTRTHSITVSRMVDAHGEVVGYVSTSEDVTDQLESQRALEDALSAEREAVERLREVDAVKDAFVSSVSHELRTPITSIHGYLELLEEGAFGPLEEAQVEAVRRVAANGRRLLTLIDDLLTLSRLQEGGLGLELDRFDLRDAVRSGGTVVGPLWHSRDLDVRLDLPDVAVPFAGDRDMVERVVVNLLGNAVKFTPDGGRVHLALSVEPVDPADPVHAVQSAEAVLTVSDTGIGIPLAEQGQLFTRFFRSSLAQRSAIPGSGLGLSIARAIVEQHGGAIAVRSQPGAGTTFQVRLPVDTPTATDEQIGSDEAGPGRD